MIKMLDFSDRTDTDISILIKAAAGKKKCFFYVSLISSGCQDGDTNSRMITKGKHLELNKMDKTFLGVVSAAVEQSRLKANRVAQGNWNSDLEADLRVPQNK